jgi:hypothetical protein
MTQQPTNAPPDDDPLAHLYRMSRTAGLGAGEYTSINSLAVASLFFGIASVMVIYGWLLLPVPLVAAILAIAALRQIRNSGGTQVGRLIAAIGLILALGLGGWQLASGGIEAIRTRADRQEIGELVNRLSKDVASNDLTEAYNLFGPKFHSAFTPEMFEQQFKIREDSPYYGKIKSIQWNGRIEFDIAGDSAGNGNDLEAVALVKVSQDRRAVDNRHDARVVCPTHAQASHPRRGRFARQARPANGSALSRGKIKPSCRQPGTGQRRRVG